MRLDQDGGQNAPPRNQPVFGVNEPPPGASNRRAPADPESLPPLGAGPGLWGVAYGALWLNAVALAALVTLPRWPGAHGWAIVAGWAAGLALVAWLGCVSRIGVHDMLVSIGLRERFGLEILLFSIGLLPRFFGQTHILLDGPLWIVPGMMLISVRPWLARRTLAVTLLGGWLAATWAPAGGAGLALVLGFGFSWLLALGATHFAHTGDPHGLGGAWPARRVVRNAALASLPGALGAVLLWWAWPAGGLNPGRGQAGLPAQPEPVHVDPIFRQMDAMELIALLWHLLIAVVVTVLAIVFLIWLRRLWFKRRAGRMAPDVLRGQEARIEFHAVAAKPPAPKLAGLRGRIVTLWGQWAAHMNQEDLGRRPGETAAHYAERVGRQEPAARPPEAITALLERAHYGIEEPTPADVEAMRELVREELSRQSLRRQAPMDEVE